MNPKFQKKIKFDIVPKILHQDTTPTKDNNILAKYYHYSIHNKTSIHYFLTQVQDLAIRLPQQALKVKGQGQGQWRVIKKSRQ